MVCNSVISRLEVAQELVKTLNLEEQITITSINSDYFAIEFFAKRPSKERLFFKKTEIKE